MEIIFTLGIMAFLGFMLFFSLGLPAETIEGDVLGASGFPILVVAIGFLLCLLLLFKQTRAKSNNAEGGKKILDISTPAGKATALSAVSLAMYLGIMNFVGFIVATLVFTILSALVMGYRKYGKLALFAVISTLALFGLFGKVFFVPLPRGIGIFRELSYLLY
ncbi:MAG: hypothetical protein CVV51_03935 [Spirochaetae bacterium HGW-Spirochaetae-7]|nr:MAG: hypothetical protein CVV51_03935 [Spirochaetae bacterium HGW-Spirochaetae-7]